MCFWRTVTGEDASLRPFCFFLRNEDRTLFLAADDMTQKDMWMEAVFRCWALWCLYHLVLSRRSR